MSWETQTFVPALPPHCAPDSEFLTHFSATFHSCVPSSLAFLSTLLGTLSIISWLFAQLPQIYKNYTIKSTSGLSIYFLVEWCLGDLSNLLGALFTGQATWQIVVAGYYCFVDSLLVAQWVWYEGLKHGRPVRWVWLGKNKNGAHHYGGDNGAGSMQQVVIDGVAVLSQTSRRPQSPKRDDSKNPTEHTPPKDIIDSQRVQRTPTAWRMPDFGAANDDDDDEKEPGSATPKNRRIHGLMQPSSSISGPSPRTVLFLACLVSLAHASPLHASSSRLQASTNTSQSNALEIAGTALSWLSTILYLLSRLPQLLKNARRRSTSGLSPHLFAAAFLGNLFYSSSILTNPLAWHDYESYGGGGWASDAGSNRVDWVLRALPFWLGAAGALGLDGAIGVQFLMYGDGMKEGEVVLVQEVEGEVNDEGVVDGSATARPEGNRTRRWRRVSGWMRGWVPRVSESRQVSPEGSPERESLLRPATDASTAANNRSGYRAVA